MTVLWTMGAIAALSAGGIAALYVRREYKLRKAKARLRCMGIPTQRPAICVSCERDLRQIAHGVFYHADGIAYPHRAMPV